MKKLNAVAALVLLLFGLNASAQDQENKKWGLQDLIEYALNENLQIKQSELDMQSSEVAKTQAWFARFPNLNAGANQSYAFGRSIDPFTNSFTTDPVRSNNFSLSGNMTLFAGLQIHNSIRQSEADMESSRYTLAATKNNISLTIANSYLTLLFNQELLAAAKFRLEGTQTQAQQVEKQVQLGALPQANLLQVRQQLATDELEVIRAENNLALTRLNLLQALQLPANTKLDIDVPVISSPNQAFVIDNPEVIYQTAESTMPEIKAAQRNVDARAIGVKVARGAYLPTVSVNASIFTQYSSIGADRSFVAFGTPEVGTIPIGVVDPNGMNVPVFQYIYGQTSVSKLSFSDQIDINRREALTFTLNVPIFNRMQTRSSVSNARINLERAQVNEQSVKNQLRQQVEQAYYDVIAAAKTFDAVQKQVVALEESNKNITQRFQLGAANVVEYNQTRNEYNRAQSDLIRAKYDYIFKLKVLDFYQGKPLQF